jgi:tight adherence protein B
MSALLHHPLLLIAGGFTASLLLLVLAFADGGQHKLARRVERLRTRALGTVAAAELKLRRNRGDERLIDQLTRRLIPRPELLRERLGRTGRSINLGTYGLTCLVVALASGMVMVMSGLKPLLTVPAALLVGLWLPHLAVGWLAGRRALRFTVTFPEAIGLMVRSIKSGLPITESFKIVGQEVADPVGAEFRQISDQIRLGQPLEQALWDSARRIATPEMKFLVVTLSIQRETGGNLAETLENLDTVLRRRRQMRLKVRAMSSEARASAMIVGALPFLMMGILAVVDNAYMAVLFKEHLGHVLLGAGASSMAFGVMVMARMVRFEI